MAQHDEHEIIDTVVAGLRKHRDESETLPAAFRFPKELSEQLGEATAIYHVSKTDVVVQSLKSVIPQLLRRADQRSVTTGTAPSIVTDISDIELLEEIRREHRSW